MQRTGIHGAGHLRQALPQNMNTETPYVIQPKSAELPKVSPNAHEIGERADPGYALVPIDQVRTDRVVFFDRTKLQCRRLKPEREFVVYRPV